MTQKAKMLNKMKISTRLIAEEALRRGYDVQYFPGGRTKTGALLITHEDRRYILKSTVGASTKGYGIFVATNKYLMSQLLQNFGIPTPDTLLFSGDETINSFLKKYKKLVVKPISTNHGVGVTTSITTPAELNTAIERAQRAGKNRSVLLQEMHEGIDYRLLVVGDRMVAAAYREPATVIGDGNSTIGELIEKENKNPERGHSHEKPLTLLNLKIISKHLLKHGYKITHIPQNNEKIYLSGVANLSQGGHAIDVTDSVHPEIAHLAVKAARIAGMSVCGVDIICKDIAKPLIDSEPKVIELNESPGIRMHHFPAKGVPRDVASLILDQAIAAEGITV